MVRDKYFSILSIMVLSLLGAAYVSYNTALDAFVRELAYITLLLIFGGIVLYSVSRRLKYAYMAGVVFFGLMLINIVYLFLNSGNDFLPLVTLLVMTAINIFGFLFTLERVGSFSKRRRRPSDRELKSIEGQLRALRDKSEVIAKELSSLDDTTPKIIIEDMPKKRKSTKKTTKKKTAKKPAKKKTTKRKSTKR